MATAREIAEWMLDQIEDEERLLQVDAVTRIQEVFGADFVYLHPCGELSIHRRVLSEFGKLTGEGVVWVTCPGGGFWPQAHWRRRCTGDGPGRTQYEY